MKSLVQVEVVDTILDMSCRVVLDTIDAAQVFADYYYDHGYEISLSVIRQLPHRGEAEILIAQELLRDFDDYMQKRTLH